MPPIQKTAANMSQQDLTANVQLLNAQVAQMSTPFEEAMNLIRDLKAKSEGAWTKFDERVNHGEVTIAETAATVTNDRLDSSTASRSHHRPFSEIASSTCPGRGQ